jgi:hypothetical protein
VGVHSASNTPNKDHSRPVVEMGVVGMRVAGMRVVTTFVVTHFRKHNTKKKKGEESELQLTKIFFAIRRDPIFFSFLFSSFLKIILQQTLKDRSCRAFERRCQFGMYRPRWWKLEQQFHTDHVAQELGLSPGMEQLLHREHLKPESQIHTENLDLGTMGRVLGQLKVDHQDAIV